MRSTGRQIGLLTVAIVILSLSAAALTAYDLWRPTLPVAVAASFDDGSYARVALPSGQLTPGARATATITFVNPGGEPVDPGDFSASVDDRPSHSLAYATWRPPESRVEHPGGSGVCARCHAMVLFPARRRSVWRFGFVVPSRVGDYALNIVRTTDPGSNRAWLPALVFRSASSPPLAHLWPSTAR